LISFSGRWISSYGLIPYRLQASIDFGLSKLLKAKALIDQPCKNPTSHFSLIKIFQ